MTIYKRLRSIGSILFLGGLVACGPTHDWRGEAVEAVVAPPLEGRNWNGERFSLDQLQGKAVVVFYGYTFCPDVCPFTLAKLKQVKTQLGDSADQLEVVFVSVDPHRDSVEKLASYVPRFDDSFYGLRLEFDELETVQEDWDITVQYGQPKDGPGTDSYYYVDHTGTYFLIDPAGHLRVTFPPNAKAEDLAADLQALINA